MQRTMPQFIYLMRLDKPIGILLLLWPTLWALWLASAGHPSQLNLFIFITGVIVMRSAGCVINDIADRHVDCHVERTSRRPLASGKMSVLSAILWFSGLMLLAFLLVLLCNTQTITLAFIGAALAMFYPLMKRFTHLPQLGLGVAFSWCVPMAFTAETNTVSSAGWFLFAACVLWPVIYDTMYAMVDRDDDKKIGVKSTAILFGLQDKKIIAALQGFFIVMLICIGILFNLKQIYYYSLIVVAMLFVYQQWLIKDRERQPCFRAFLNNNWVGLVIFLGILLSDVS